jgi:hypothetical protein
VPLLYLPPIDGRIFGLRLQGRNVTDVADALKLSRQAILRAIYLWQDPLSSIAGGTDR